MLSFKNLRTVFQINFTNNLSTMVKSCNQAQNRKLTFFYFQENECNVNFKTINALKERRHQQLWSIYYDLIQIMYLLSS